MYHPTLGRWTAPDPAGYIDGMNLYQYCSSNPAAQTDPMGLCDGNGLTPNVKGVLAFLNSVASMVLGVASEGYWFLRKGGLLGPVKGRGEYLGFKVGGMAEAGGIFGYGGEGGVRIYGSIDTGKVFLTLYGETQAGGSTAFVGAGGVVGGIKGYGLRSQDQVGGIYTGGEVNGGLAVVEKVGAGVSMTGTKSGTLEVGPNLMYGKGLALVPPAGYLKACIVTGNEYPLTAWEVPSWARWMLEPLSLVDPYVPRPAK